MTREENVNKPFVIDEGKAEMDYCFTKMMNNEKINPTWTEEDEKRVNRISDFIWKNRKGDTDEIYQQEQDVNWIKSLKDRYTWKPSEKQINALSDVLSIKDIKYDVLSELLKCLKKLK